MPLPTHRSERQTQYLLKLLPYLSMEGISPHTVDTLTRWIDISRATFYHYFASKEDVVDALIRLFVTYLEQATAEMQQDDMDYGTRFQRVYMQSLMIVGYASPRLMQDIKQHYPVPWEAFHRAERQRARQLEHFYEQGIAAQQFHRINSRLLLLQEAIFLPAIVEMAVLVEQELSLTQILREYYTLQKYQLLPLQVCQHLDDTEVLHHIERFAQKWVIIHR
jgi:AcrR family transcriptional regulator